MTDFGPIDKQWVAAGLGGVVGHVCWLAKAITGGDFKRARYCFIDATETALLLAKRFPFLEEEEIAVTFVVNGNVVLVAAPSDTKFGVARDMAIARYGGDPDVYWETRDEGGHDVFVGTLPVSVFAKPGAAFYVTLPIGAGG